ncbi:MAG TPA: hypothetical protein PK886_01295 [Candidatus Paceibacterota bacterium]|nr:hypothetical protein [Candidatus Paceibacterota bacterium]
MINFERVTKFNIEEKIQILGQNFLDKGQFFGSVVVLETFLNRNNKELYIASDTKNNYLVLFKVLKNEYRFLFSEPNEDFLNKFKEQFDPRYIGVNLLNNKSKNNICGIDQELTLDVDKIISSEDAGFRKDLNRSFKYNQNIVVSKYSYEKDIGDLLKFLEEWRFARSDDANKYAFIENDLSFLVGYGGESYVKGVIIRDNSKNKIIGYCLFIPQTKDLCISVYSKVLRGYENLGVLLTFEKCKYVKEEGYKKLNLGSINNDFKKSLEWAGNLKEVFSTEIYRFSQMKFKNTPEEYSTLLLR